MLGKSMFFEASEKQELLFASVYLFSIMCLTKSIVKPKQAGSRGRSTKYHPQCQISIYVQFSL